MSTFPSLICQWDNNPHIPQHFTICQHTQLEKCSSPPPLQCRCLSYPFHSLTHSLPSTPPMALHKPPLHQMPFSSHLSRAVLAPIVMISSDTELEMCSPSPPLQYRCLTFLFHSFFHRRPSFQVSLQKHQFPEPSTISPTRGLHICPHFRRSSNPPGDIQ